MTVSSVEIPLSEYFDDSFGRLSNYDAYDPAQQTALAAQTHRDLRCFQTVTAVNPRPMYALDELVMSDLSDFDNPPGGTPRFFVTQEELEAEPVTLYDEAWSIPTATHADRNYWWGASQDIDSTPGTFIGSSRMAPMSVADLPSTWEISLALPAFPASALNLSTSWVRFYNDPVGGGRNTGPFVSIPFTGLTNGDQELKFAITALAPLNYTFTTVTFGLSGTATATLRCLAIRALPTTWQQAPLDINTLTGRLVRPVSRNGAASPTLGFPANSFSDPQVPTDWPILLRSTTPASSEDPRPNDLSQALIFGTGHFTNGDIRVYFREGARDLITQLDLDLWDAGLGITQAELEALDALPDFGSALYRAKTQADVDGLTMGTLDDNAQFDLEAQPDYVSASWVEVKISWTSGTPTVAVSDTEGNTYSFAASGLVADTDYIAFIELVEDTMSVRIYHYLGADQIDYTAPVFDSTVIRDNFLLSVRPGRIGWYAHFADGNAYVDSVRSYNANFAEYRSVPLRSRTPVVGGQVFFGGSPARESITSIVPVNGAVLADDTTLSSSGQSHRITVSSTVHSGAQSNPFTISDFDDATVSLRMWFPSSAYAAGGRPAVALIDSFGAATVMPLGAIAPDRWQSFRFNLGSIGQHLLPGEYRLLVVGDGASAGTIFYVDNLSVLQQALSWTGRANASDAWDDDPGAWIPFGSTTNAQTAGVLFAERGTTPQVRAIARYQNAALTQVQFVPKYAELGRLVWDDQRPQVDPPVPSSIVATDLGGHTMEFKLTGGTPVTLHSGRFVVYYEWSFGDGVIDVGSIVTHTYAAPGNYTASLTVVDNTGQRGTTFRTVTVSLMTDTINVVENPVSVAQVDFSWSPGANAGAPTYVYPNGHDSGSYRVYVDEVTTFTALVFAPPRTTVVAYEWDFGDGVKAFGPVVTHTFRILNPGQRVTLCVTSSDGVRQCVGRQVMLTAVTASNRVTNPGFETDAANWSSTLGTSTRDSASNGFLGTGSMKMTRTLSGDITMRYQSTTDVAGLKAGDVTSASAYLKAAVTGRSVSLTLRYIPTIGSPVTGTGTITDNTTTFTRVLAQNIIVPQFATTLQIDITVTGATGTDIHWLDAVMLNKGATAQAYMDGNSSGAYWAGTPQASTSWS
jgi:hypothetical protein